MDKFIAECSKSLHHVIVTPNKFKVARPHLYQPMHPILDKDGKIKMHQKFNFPMSALILEEDRLNVLATKWLSPASFMKDLDATPKLLVNKLKDFFNNSDVAIFNHETGKETHPFCNHRKPEHLHVLIHFNQPCIRDLPKFRSIKRLLKLHDCDLYTRKIVSNEQNAYSYCINDAEKLFLGTNSQVAETITRCAGNEPRTPRHRRS
ncbi:hypothetical protein PoB_001292700 [Plakobranchus ocellatus]|uniref:HIT domain-containing protein n=1 Tax=Plakobranchus ocellatus TaxID=259542 RepID=A0AAV3YW77_9GAST|nr:hypothetical protein PoB_001292700 [Plakobranchus ocellatus]